MKTEKRYTATYTIYLHAYNDKHARSKAKLIAKRERINWPAQDCALDKLESTPFASFDIKEISLND